MSDPTPRGNGTGMVPHDTEPMPSLYGVLARAAQDPSFDLSKFQALLQAHREEKAEQARQAFDQALGDAQREMRAVFRGAANQQTNSRYATLESMDEPTRPIYTGYGFSLTFSTAKPDHPDNIRVVCTCAHKDGHRELYELEAGADMTGAQGRVNKTALHGLGSTLTYLRRYLFMLVWNIVLTNDSDDDDGNAGGISAGMAENIRRPAPPAQQRRTYTVVLDEIEADAKNAGTEEDIASLRREDRCRFIAEKGAPEYRARLAQILDTELARIAAFREAEPAVSGPNNEAVPPADADADPDASQADKIIIAIKVAPTAEVIQKAILGNIITVNFLGRLHTTGRKDLIDRLEAARQARLAELGTA